MGLGGMIHRHFADNTNEQSVATRLRRRRFRILEDMLKDLTDPVTLLDIGGTPQYWETMLASSVLADRLSVTMINTEAHSVSRHNVAALTGDGRAMPQFADQQFDVVFSNSTIEHVGDRGDQERMAQEIRRIGRRYYVQTPNRHFPIEPHFVFPFFQYLPVPLRVWMVQHWKLGWHPKLPDRQQALRAVTGIRLLSREEMRELFPDARIFEERLYGLVKSFEAFRR